MKNYFTARRIAKIGIFSAMAVILYFLNFSIPVLFPSFLALNLSDIPALIGGFSMGPVAGGIIILIKILIKLPFSQTMCVGEFSDFVNGLAFVLVSSFYYKYHRTKKGAVLSLIFGSLSSILIAVVCNIFVMIPLYLTVFGFSLSDIASLCPSAFNVTADNFYVYYTFGAVIPFNLLRCLAASLVTFLLYKSMTGLINKIDGPAAKKANAESGSSVSAEEPESSDSAGDIDKKDF